MAPVTPSVEPTDRLAPAQPLLVAPVGADAVAIRWTSDRPRAAARPRRRRSSGRRSATPGDQSRPARSADARRRRPGSGGAPRSTPALSAAALPPGGSISRLTRSANGASASRGGVGRAVRRDDDLHWSRVVGGQQVVDASRQAMPFVAGRNDYRDARRLSRTRGGHRRQRAAGGPACDNLRPHAQQQGVACVDVDDEGGSQPEQGFHERISH